VKNITHFPSPIYDLYHIKMKIVQQMHYMHMLHCVQAALAGAQRRYWTPRLFSWHNTNPRFAASIPLRLLVDDCRPTRFATQFAHMAQT